MKLRTRSRGIRYASLRFQRKRKEKKKTAQHTNNSLNVVIAIGRLKR